MDNSTNNIPICTNRTRRRLQVDGPCPICDGTGKIFSAQNLKRRGGTMYVDCYNCCDDG